MEQQQALARRRDFCSVAPAATAATQLLQLAAGPKQKQGEPPVTVARCPLVRETRSEAFAGVTLACRALRSSGRSGRDDWLRGKAQARAALGGRPPGANSRAAGQLTLLRSAVAASAAEETSRSPARDGCSWAVVASRF
jgi:hypothetical protein